MVTQKQKAERWDDLQELAKMCGSTKKASFSITKNMSGKWKMHLVNVGETFENDCLHNLILDVYAYIDYHRKPITPEIQYTL